MKFVTKQTTEQAKKNFFADMASTSKVEQKSPKLTGSPSVFRQDLYKKLPALSSPIFTYVPSSPNTSMQNGTTCSPLLANYRSTILGSSILGSSATAAASTSNGTRNPHHLRIDSSSEYDSEEGDKWEPLPSEMGITLQARDHSGDDPARLPMISIVPPTPSDTLSLAPDSERQVILNIALANWVFM